MPLVAYKFRFYPNAEQSERLERMFGSARWVWNAALEWRSTTYRLDGESVTGVNFSRELTFLKRLDSLKWLRETPGTVYAQALRDQDKAFSAFVSGRAKYPRFKHKKHAQSIRMQLDQRVVLNHFRDKEYLRLPGLGALNVVWSRPVRGIPKMVTVRRDASGRYFVSMMAERAIKALPPRTNTVGLDFGLKDIVVTSDGWKSGNPQHQRKVERALKRAQRARSRKIRGSHRYEKASRKVARLCARVADARADVLHKLSTCLVREHQVIAIEDLNVKGMARTWLAKSIGEAGLSELRRQLTYKAQWYGRDLRVVDRWAPTSKTCSKCGFVRKEMPLSVRSWTCPKCCAEHDRDINAARNILALATAGERG